MVKEKKILGLNEKAKNHIENNGKSNNKPYKNLHINLDKEHENMLQEITKKTEWSRKVIVYKSIKKLYDLIKADQPLNIFDL